MNQSGLIRTSATGMTRTTIALTIRFLNIDFDLLGGELGKQMLPLFRNHLAARCFSLQNALGSADRSGPRKLAARVAWISLNLRHVSQNLVYNLSRADQPLKPEMAISMVGLVKWSLDLFVYIVQELMGLFFALKHEAVDRSGDLDWIQEWILTHHSPALILLLTSLPRLFLRVSFRPLRYGYAHSQKGFANTALGNEQRGAFHKLLGVYGSTPVNQTSLGPLEDFVTSIEKSVETAFADAGITPGPARQILERDMFVSGAIPPSLLSVCTSLLTDNGPLDTLLDRLDAGKIHTHDVSWLGLTDDVRTQTFIRGHVIDVVRKMPLGGSVRVRVCPRCGSVMEDIGREHAGGSQGQMAWVWQSHKVCVCFSSWGAPEEGDREGKKA